LLQPFSESGHEAIGECEEFDWVDGGYGRLLFHLHATAAAVGCSGDGIDGCHGLQEVTTDFQ
jgi:hypothetical protein